MADSTPEAAVEAPFVTRAIRVAPDWIDFNGHMNVAYYMKAFDRALDDVYERIGLKPDQLAAAGASTFAAEMHITYQRELREGDALRVETQLLGFDAKRVHFVQSMYHAGESYLAATNEWLLLSIDMVRRKVSPMPALVQQRLARVRAAHATLPVPPEVGRRIAFDNRPPR